VNGIQRGQDVIDHIGRQPKREFVNQQQFWPRWIPFTSRND